MHGAFRPQSLPFWGVHLVAIAGVALTGWSWPGLALAVGFYYLRMFGVCAGYHRYFSHRSFKTSRLGQFLLAFLAMSSTQKSVLWWAALHRHHHRHSDQEEDIHSPVLRSFFSTSMLAARNPMPLMDVQLMAWPGSPRERRK